MKHISIAKLISTIAGLALLAGQAHAAIVSWDNGAATLNWGDANNWNPNGVPAGGSQIQFNGVGAGSAQVPTGSTVNLNVATSSSPATELDLKNGTGFKIGGFGGSYTYMGTIKVQDAFDYTILSTDTGLSVSGSILFDVVVGGTMTLDHGLTVAGFGTGQMTKTGAGTTYLTGGLPANSSTVNMSVTGGILSTASLANLGTGYLAAQTGGTFQYTGGNTSKTGLLYWNSGSGNFDITSGNATFNVTGGDLSSGTFTKTGAGTMTIATSGTSINFGVINVNDGTFSLQANGANTINFISTVTGAAGKSIKVLAGTGVVENNNLTANWSSNLAGMDIASGGTFDIRGNLTKVDALTGSGTASIINSYYKVDSGIQGHTLTVGVNGGSGTYSGTFTSSTATTDATPGLVSLTKTGAGTQELSGTGIVYRGPTSITGGTLKLTDATAFNSTVTVTSPATLELNRTGAAWTFSNSISGTGTLSKTGTGTVTISTMPHMGTSAGDIGAFSMQDGVLNATNSDGYLVVGHAGTAGTFTQTGGTFNNNGASVAKGVYISNGGGSAGQMTLSGGTFNNTSGGVLYVGQSAAGTLTVNGGTLNQHEQFSVGSGGGTSTVNFSSGTITQDFGYLVIGNGATGTWTQTGGNYTRTGGAGYPYVTFIASGGTGSLSVTGGRFTESAYIDVGRYSTGTLTVGGTGTVITPQLRLTDDAVAGGTGTVNLNTGGILQIGSGGITRGGTSGTFNFNFDGGTLKASASFAMANNLTTATVKSGGAVLDSNGNTITINQALVAGSPSGGLTKTGPGTLDLTNATNTYSGNTTVNGGTLKLTSAGSFNNIASSPTITVGSGAFLDVNGLSSATLILGAAQTLKGTGTVVGNLTVQAGAHVSPGNSPGILTDNGNVLWGAGGHYDWEINNAFGTYGGPSGWDKWQINGDLTIAPTFNIDVTVDPAAYGSLQLSPSFYKIATFTGTLTGFNPGSFLVNSPGLAWHVSNIGNDIYLNFDAYLVPEPSVALLLAVGGLLVWRRRSVRS